MWKPNSLTVSCTWQIARWAAGSRSAGGTNWATLGTARARYVASVGALLPFDEASAHGDFGYLEGAGDDVSLCVSCPTEDGDRPIISF